MSHQWTQGPHTSNANHAITCARVRCRWGRGSETYGEDPGLTSNMLSAYVRGMQYGAPAPAPALPSTEMPPSPPAPKYLKVAAVCKHFAAYSLEEADGQMRFWFDAIITKQDLADTYLPAFKACVNAEVSFLYFAFLLNAFLGLLSSLARPAILFLIVNADSFFEYNIELILKARGIMCSYNLINGYESDASSFPSPSSMIFNSA